MMRWLLTTALGALFLTAAAPAFADGEAGDKGELFVSADRLMGLLDFTSTKTSTGVMGGVATASHNFSAVAFFQNPYATPVSVIGENASIAPYNFPRFSLDYTVMPHLTIGGSIVFAFNPGSNDTAGGSGDGASTSSTAASTKLTEIGFAPRVGYFMAFNRFLAIWPRLGPSIYWLHATEPGTGMGSSTSTADVTTLMLNIEPMVAITPINHVAFTAGPTLDFSFWGQAKETSDAGAATSATTSSNLFLFHFGIELGMTAWL
jgi:hypothetical protein